MLQHKEGDRHDTARETVGSTAKAEAEQNHQKHSALYHLVLQKTPTRGLGREPVIWGDAGAQTYGTNLFASSMN